MKTQLTWAFILAGVIAGSAWACGGGGDAEARNPAQMMAGNEGGHPQPPQFAQMLSQNTDSGRGWLGLRVEDAEADGKTAGAKVTFVTPGSPAAQVGIQEGDVITDYQGQSISEARQLRDMLYQSNPNAKVNIALDRKGEKLTVSPLLTALSGGAAAGGVAMPGTPGMAMQNTPHPPNQKMYPGMFQEQMMNQTPLKYFSQTGKPAAESGEHIQIQTNSGYRDVIYPFLSHKVDLGLDTEQINKLEALQRELKKNAIQLDAQIQVAELEIEELFAAPETKMGQIEVKIRQLEDARSQKLLFAAQTLKKAQDVLTADQRKKLPALNIKP